MQAVTKQIFSTTDEKNIEKDIDNFFMYNDNSGNISREEIYGFLISHPKKVYFVTPNKEIIKYILTPSQHHFEAAFHYIKYVHENNILNCNELIKKINLNSSEYNDKAIENEQKIIKFLIQHSCVVLRTWVLNVNLDEYIGVNGKKDMINIQQSNLDKIICELNFNDSNVSCIEETSGTVYIKPYKKQKHR